MNCVSERVWLAEKQRVQQEQEKRRLLWPRPLSEAEVMGLALHAARTVGQQEGKALRRSLVALAHIFPVQKNDGLGAGIHQWFQTA